MKISDMLLQQEGLSMAHDGATYCGTRGEYTFLILMGRNELVVSVLRGGEEPDKESFRDFVKARPELSGCKTAGTELLSFLHENGYENCCEISHAVGETVGCMTSGVPQLVAPALFTEFSRKADQNERIQAETPENIGRGIFGALIGGLIGVAGVVIVNWTKDGFGGGVSFIGEGFVIISMIASACSTGLIKKFGQFDSPVVMSGWQFMLGGAVMAVCGFAAGGRLGSENPMAYVVLLYLALLSAVAYSIWAVLLRANPVSRVAVYTFLQPIFGVILSLLLVDRNSDAPLLRYAVALALICVSIAVVNRGQRMEETGKR